MRAGFPSRLRMFATQSDTVDLKLAAVDPVVKIARWAALSAGSDALSTLERLDAAAAANILDGDDVSSLRDCFQLAVAVPLASPGRSVAAWRAGRRCGVAVGRRAAGTCGAAQRRPRGGRHQPQADVSGVDAVVPLAAVSLSYQRMAHRASPSAVWRAAPPGGLTPHCRDRSPKSGSGSRPVPRTAATASGTTSTRPVVPARGKSVSAKHFRQALGVEPGDHADHRRIGRPLIDQFGGLRRGVDARDVQRTLSCLRVAPVEAADRQPGRIGRCQVEVGDVDTQMQPGLLVTVAADDRDLPGPAGSVQARRLRVDEDQWSVWHCHQNR